jgi:hypothetical protein
MAAIASVICSYDWDALAGDGRMAPSLSVSIEIEMQFLPDV